MDAYQFENLSPTKQQRKAPKTATPKASAGKGSEQARRGTAANTGVKRFVDISGMFENESRISPLF